MGIIVPDGTPKQDDEGKRSDEQVRRIEPADGLHRTAPYAEPGLTMEYGEDGEPLLETRTAGWDVSFGCRINFGPNPDGGLRVSVHVADQAKRAGLAVSPTTPSQLRALARALVTIADDQDQRTRPGMRPGSDA